LQVIKAQGLLFVVFEENDVSAFVCNQRKRSEILSIEFKLPFFFLKSSRLAENLLQKLQTLAKKTANLNFCIVVSLIKMGKHYGQPLWQ